MGSVVGDRWSGHARAGCEDEASSSTASVAASGPAARGTTDERNALGVCFDHHRLGGAVERICTKTIGVTLWAALSWST